jgi:hypothetical protein
LTKFAFVSRTREHVAFAAVEHRAEHVTFKHLTGFAEVAVVLGKVCGKDIITDLAIAELRKEMQPNRLRWFRLNSAWSPNPH